MMVGSRAGDWYTVSSLRVLKTRPVGHKEETVSHPLPDLHVFILDFSRIFSFKTFPFLSFHVVPSDAPAVQRKSNHPPGRQGTTCEGKRKCPREKS